MFSGLPCESHIAHRSLQPAKPAPRSEFFPGFFFSKLSSKPTVSANLPGIGARAKVGILPSKKKSSCPVGGQLSKVSANLPGRAAPARRHGGTQLMSRITNYEAVADYFGHWLHRAQVSLSTGAFDQRL